MLWRSPALSIVSPMLPDSIAVDVEFDLARPTEAAMPFDVTAAVICGAVAVLNVVTSPLLMMVSMPSVVMLSLMDSTLTSTPMLLKSMFVSTVSDLA